MFPHIQMTSETIKVFCRIKPVEGITSTVEYELENDRNKGAAGTLEVFIPEGFGHRHTLSNPSYKFAFNHIFDQDVEQEEIFTDVAKPVLENCLQGFNGTIFVYGQTATGKTYTVTGETDKKIVQSRKKYRRKKAKTIKASKSPAIDTNPESESKVDVQQESLSQVDNESINVAEAATENTQTQAQTTPEIKDASEEIHPGPSENWAIRKTRGIVPRTLAYLFSYFSDNETDRELSVSYYEIYKETGYDLLHGLQQNERVEDIKHLTKIKAMTDGNRKLHLKYLSRHTILDEKHALELLEHGNAHRQVAETHLNDASSRSHCIFTIYLKVKNPETESILQSKINLVDLAGSERLGKSHEKNDKIMAEGKNINLSLHHLQQVIISLTKKKATLQQRKRHHIPYRNSTMTLVLSDSLGGNSFTSMIATINAEEKDLEESISTCRFAQQVATVTNEVVVNEIPDAELVIARLQEELQQMKLQLENAVNSSIPPSPDVVIDDLDNKIREFLEASDETAMLNVGKHEDNVQYCFKDMKSRLLQQLEENRKLQEALNAAMMKKTKSKACLIL